MTNQNRELRANEFCFSYFTLNKALFAKKETAPKSAQRKLN